MSNININRDYIVTVDVKKSTVSSSGNMKFYITDMNTSNIYFKLVIDASSNRYVSQYGQNESSDNYRLFLRVINPNNKPFTIEANRMDKPENFFLVDLNEEQKGYIGTYTCELFIETDINGRTERSTTNSFTYQVTESIMNRLDEEVEADPDYPIIDSIYDEFRSLDYATHEYVDNALANVNLTKYAPIDSPRFTGSISLGRSENSLVGKNSVSVGGENIASDDYAFAEGYRTHASKYASHAEGIGTLACDGGAHAEGFYTIAGSMHQHVQGKYNLYDDTQTYAHIVGNGGMSDEIQDIVRSNAHTLDWNGNAWYQGDVFVGGTSQNDSNKLATELYVNEALANIEINSSGSISTDSPVFTTSLTLGNRKEDNEVGVNSIALGKNNIASGEYAHAEGYVATASGKYSYANGYKAEASGKYAHAEGSSVIASGDYSYVQGSNSNATGEYSYASGYSVESTARASHAEGLATHATNTAAHAEGAHSTASGNSSHAEGWQTTARGYASHAEGQYTKAMSESQHVQGKYNIEDYDNRYAHIVGNGYKDYEFGGDIQSNAHTLDWQGNAWYQGDVFVGGSSQDEGKRLATVEYVNNAALGGSGIDLSDYATISYVDNALANAGGSGSSDIPVIDGGEGGRYLTQSDLLTLNDYGMYSARQNVILRNIWIAVDEYSNHNFINEMVYISGMYEFTLYRFNGEIWKLTTCEINGETVLCIEKKDKYITSGNSNSVTFVGDMEYGYRHRITLEDLDGLDNGQIRTYLFKNVYLDMGEMDYTFVNEVVDVYRYGNEFTFYTARGTIYKTVYDGDRFICSPYDGRGDIDYNAKKSDIDNKFWIGSQTDYDALEYKDPNVIYLIEEA